MRKINILRTIKHYAPKVYLLLGIIIVTSLHH